MRRLMQAIAAAALIVLPACYVDVDDEVYEPTTEEVTTQGDIDKELLVPQLDPTTIELPDLTRDPTTETAVETPGRYRPDVTMEEVGAIDDGHAIAELCKVHQGLCDWEEWQRIPPR